MKIMAPAIRLFVQHTVQAYGGLITLTKGHLCGKVFHNFNRVLVGSYHHRCPANHCLRLKKIKNVICDQVI